MTVPDARLDIKGTCSRCGWGLEFEAGSWACHNCDTIWDHQGKHGRSARLPPHPSLLDRPTDSTSPSVLDQPQPDVEMP